MTLLATPATLRVAELVEPLKGGGSLPWRGVASDGRACVVKFAGTGHGPDALLAELVVGRLASALGAAVPEVRPVWLDAGHPRVGTDEFWDVLDRSAGWNLAVDLIPGARELTHAEALSLPGESLQQVVLVDLLFANLDRTPSSLNLVRGADGRVFMIDHGSCRLLQRGERELHRFELGPDHVFAGRDPKLRLLGLAPPRLDRDAIAALLDPLPRAWLDAAGWEDAGAIHRLVDRRLRAFLTWLRI